MLTVIDADGDAGMREQGVTNLLERRVEGIAYGATLRVPAGRAWLGDPIRAEAGR